MAGGWEAGFLLAGAAKASAGGDSGYVAGCLFRAVGVLEERAQALLGAVGRSPAELIATLGAARQLVSEVVG
ncbi:hypothetical protein O7614_29815 [Micromonospora sp. WMMD961]|uniref:hypothetical protein n=1 Tax=Micromonospora sp. WMMD961 TaxID=3016100 RepID=UPI0024166233|nr:hypothetical protein [Micromonospora sp. WMMD961]MDG4783858.1 hypothetical protein [Micromonospora sp. WMMD961]